MIRALQENLHWITTANDLLAQLMLEWEADLLINSEQCQNRVSRAWVSDTLGTATIRILNPAKVPVEAYSNETGNVWIKSRGLAYVNCYLTPSDNIAYFQEKLDLLKDAIREKGDRIMVAWVFNARAIEWDMPRPDSRLKGILEFATRTELMVIDKGDTPTFR